MPAGHTVQSARESCNAKEVAVSLLKVPVMVVI